MISYFNGRELFKCNYLMAYILYFVANLKFSIGLNLGGNISYVCENSTLTSESGTLYSSKFPGFYNNQEYCVTNISVPRAFFIEISFEVFQTESVSNLNLQNDMCLLDFIEIIVNNTSKRICGDWTGKERLLYFIFNTSFISIRFRSNDHTTKRGFALKWDATLAHATNEISSCKRSLLETATSCFEIITKPENWLSGQQVCRRRGASLAKIENFQTQSELESSIYESKLNFPAIWIGANDRLFEGDYMWPDRSAITFHNWFPGWRHFNESITHNIRQPSDDGYSDEDCVEIRRQFSYPGKGTGQTNSYFWNDRNCEEKNPFICQYDKHISKRSVDHVPLHCGKLLQLSDDTPNVILTTPDFPQNYPALASCHTILTAPFGKQIHVDFLHFDIEDGKQCEYDNLTISELPSTINGRNVVHCGNWNRKLKLLRWTSDTNKITISFQCDNSKQFSGYRVNISIVDNAKRCSEIDSAFSSLYHPEGCLFLANGSRNFTNAEQTCSSIGASVATGQSETVYFADNILNSTHDCKNVWINSGNSSSFENDSFTSDNDSVCDAVQICGSQKYEGNILLEYESVVTQVPCSSLNAVLCKKPAKRMERNESTQNFTTANGHLNTYNSDDKNYSNNLNTSLYFEAKDGYRIIFELLSYDIEFQDQCLYDYIETIGMTEDKKYCGKSKDAISFMSKSFSSVIRFKTDEDITATGFNLSWYWVKEGEAFQTVKQEDNSVITMHSVNYPNAFPSEIKNCSSVILDDGIRLIATIEQLALPGSHCQDSRFEIKSGSNVIKTFCGGTTLGSLDYFSRYILTNYGNISFCLTAPQLEMGEGISMHLQQVNGNYSQINNTITLIPNESMAFSSLMFPLMFPAKTTHDVIFRTNIGYQVTVTLNVIIKKGNQCLVDTIELIDISLKDDNRGLKFHPCENVSDEVDNLPEVVFSSFLNAVRVVLSSGDHTSNNSSFKVSGIISSVKDPSYLNKTRRETGAFDECNDDTCENGGSCLNATEGRYTCSCQPQYTGLFCQATKCDLDLNPCHPKHAKCRLTNSGFTCECETGYWGNRCTMNSIDCQYKLCSGNGHCVQINDTETGCLCNELYTGPRCSISIPEPEENLTIGQKLLKEPIWIGMIVILNLVLFFCVSYVIRRKCGKRIAKLFPKKKPTRSNSKEPENSKGEQSSTSADHVDRNISSVSLKTPVFHRDSRWSVRKQAYREKLDSISAPSTPTVNEDNQDAAMKLFAAYNTKKPELSPNITAIQGNNLPIKTRDIMSCGIQGGTVTLNPDIEFENHNKDNVHGILRSYTISTEIRDFESRISKARREAASKKASSYAGSPTTARIAKSEVTRPKVTHCFPEIRIINENNCEEINVSDSDEQSVLAMPVVVRTSQSKSAENVSEVKTSDQHDSGYPSTTISTTHDGSQVEDTNLKTIPSASVKRKLFSSKAKSASFYKLGNENDIVKTENRKDTRDSLISELSFKRSTSGEFRSFESERCISCKREQIERCAYSYETDLDKMHRCRSKRQYSTGYSGLCNHHKRHRRRRKCGCSKHHSYSKETDCHSHDLHGAPVRLKREQYMPPCQHKSSFGDTWNLPRYHRTMKHLNSSTESDTCLCSAHEIRSRRRHYHVKEAFSENGFLNRYDSAQNRGLDVTPPRIDFRSDASCKSTLMKSFLSDTYRASCHAYSSSETPGENFCQNKHFLASPQDSSVSSSRDKSRSPSPRTSSPRQLTLISHSAQRKRSDTVVEIANDNVIKLDVSPVSSSNSDILQCHVNSLNSPSAIDLTKNCRVELSPNEDYEDNPELKTDIDFSTNETNNSYGKVQHLPEAESISQNIYTNHNTVSESIDQPKSAITYETKPLKERVIMQKDSAYQTKQSSVDKLKSSDSLSRGSNSMKSKLTETTDSQEILNRNDDRVQRHLHQAALKLALLKRLQTKKDYSKDSAIHTFSEDDLSTDDGETRGSFRPLVKRTSGSLAFQLRETSLSQVQEEHSGVSRDTENYNSPTNEPFCGSLDKSPADIVGTGIPMTDISSTHTEARVAQLEETNV